MRRCSCRRRSPFRDRADQLLAALDAVERELVDGAFPFADSDEDIHMAIDRRVTEIAGSVGERLHAARSGRDQVATDMAMFVRAHGSEATRLLADLAGELVALAERHIDWAMPTYSGCRQPVFVSDHLLAYVWMLVRDRRRFAAVVAETASLPHVLRAQEPASRPPAGSLAHWGSPT